MDEQTDHPEFVETIRALKRLQREAFDHGVTYALEKAAAITNEVANTIPTDPDVGGWFDACVEIRERLLNDRRAR